MALATVEFVGFEQGRAQFKSQLGVNRFFQFAIGKGRRRGQHGLSELEQVAFVSPLQGPVRESHLGRIQFSLPRSELEAIEAPGEQVLIQVKTFRDGQKRGPAVSEMIPVPREFSDELEAPMGFSASPSGGFSMTTATQYSQPMSATSTQSIRVKAFNFKQKKYSNAMFIQALIPAITSALPAIGSAVSSALPAISGALPHVLPHLAPLVGGLLGSLGGQSSNVHAQRAGRTAEAVLNHVGTQENAQHLAALIQQIVQLQRNGGAAAVTPAAAQAANPTAQSIYSNAQVAPIAAALPALLPLLQQVLTPETVQSVLNMPNQHMQTIINGIKDVSQLALQSHEQDLRHLREIHPDLEDPELNQLLMSMSANLRHSSETTYQRVPSVELTAQSHSVTINGQLRVLYALSASNWRFPFQVSTPRTINEATLQLVVKDQHDLRVVLRKNIPVGEVNSGDVINAAELQSADIQRLRGGKTYIVVTHLIWRNSANEKRGISRQQEISPIQDVVFDRIEEQGDLIPLNDVRKFGDHWHKIWQDRFTADVGEHVIEARYYLQFDANEQRLARYESQARFREESREKHGQLRTGVEWTFGTLDDLNRTLNPLATALTDPQKQALGHEDFKRRFGTVAHHRVDMRGSRGKLGEIWVYPVVKLQQVIFKTPDMVRDTGLVESLTDQTITLPIPVQVHFVGYRS